MKKFIIFILCLSISNVAFAGSSTVLNIIKTTVLTNSDAERFISEFGPNQPDPQESSKEFSFHCIGLTQACEITAKNSSFSGMLAEQMLNGRSMVEFSSSNGNFSLSCSLGSHGAVCNVSQKHAILE